MKKLYSFLLGTLIACISLAQDYADDNAKYFDDGGISDARNGVKLNVSGLIGGDLSLFYERVFSDKFSLEGGVGVQLPYFMPDATMWMEEDMLLERVSVKGGYSFWLSPRGLFSVGDSDMDYVYSGFLFKKRSIKLTDTLSYDFMDFAFVGGYQFFLGDKIFFDLGTGVGARKIDREIDSLTFSFLIWYKLGYIF